MLPDNEEALTTSPGQHYLSNATCLVRPPLFEELFVVSRVIILCHNICHFVRKHAVDEWW